MRKFSAVLFTSLTLQLTSLLLTPQTKAATITVTPDADSYTHAVNTTTNYGRSSTLRTGSNPVQRTYLKFTISGLGGAPINTARLELYANGSSALGYEIYQTTNLWQETTLNYNNAPALGSFVAASGAHGGARWTAVDVSSYVNSENTFSFVMTSANSSDRTYGSRESTNVPKLIIDTGVAGPTPTPSPTQIPTPTPLPSPTPTPSPTPQPTPTPTPGPTTTPTPIPPTPTPTSVVPTGTPTPTPQITPNTDFSDALLLYSSSKTNADSGFDKVVRYYGLKLAEVNLATTPLTDARLRDELGNYYSTIHIDATTAGNSTVLDSSELSLLRNAVEVGGSNLLISNLRANPHSAVSFLTRGEITGSTAVNDTSKDYIVTDSQTAVTREFSRLTITHSTDPQDFALNISSNTNTTVLVKATDNTSSQYNLFARHKLGSGSTFVISNYVDAYLKNNLLHENYTNRVSDDSYQQQWFSQITPLFMFVRYSAGNEAWHNDVNYANFTLDDPELTPAGFDYAAILNEARDHNFHFTLAMPADKGDDSDPAVVDLFRNNPGYLSIIMHGNNHDGYEFYKYTALSSDPYPSRPYNDQVADINQALSRYSDFQTQTGLDWTRAFIFPYNISPTQTLVYLKRNNFQATLNSTDVPLGENRVRTWDAHIYAAELAYGNFPVIFRQHMDDTPYPFNFFLDKPGWGYQHKGVFITHGYDWVNPIADRINQVEGGVTWQSIDYILKKMYLEKANDDGSIAVQLYGNNVVVDNPSNEAKTYRFQRKETQNVPISAVTVNNTPVTYRIENGLLIAETIVPANSAADFRITYQP